MAATINLYGIVPVLVTTGKITLKKITAGDRILGLSCGVRYVYLTPGIYTPRQRYIPALVTQTIFVAKMNSLVLVFLLEEISNLKMSQWALENCKTVF